MIRISYTMENRNEQVIAEIMKTYNGVYAEVRKRSFKLYESLGVTVPQFSALQVLRANEKCTVTELSRKLYLNQSTVSSLIDRLEKSGFVTREKGKDKRKSYLHLTAKGKKLTETLPIQPLDIFRKLFSPLALEEKREFLRLLRKICAPFLTEMEVMEKELVGERP